jgi:hypothetical protein
MRKLRNAYINDLVEWNAPRDSRKLSWGYARTTTMDAHLGDGLFHLCALVHGYMASIGQEFTPTSPRKYQSVREIDGNHEVLFKPSGEHRRYFLNYIARINSAGWRDVIFPIHLYMHRIDLSGVSLPDLDISRADLSRANLNDAFFHSGFFIDANLSGAVLKDATFDGTDLRVVNLSHADISGAGLSRADLSDADLSDADIRGADLSRANLNNANLNNANLNNANLNNANLNNANFGLGLLFLNSKILDEIEKAEFDFLYFDQEILDRTAALQRLRRILAGEMGSDEAKQVEAKDFQESEAD